MAENVYLVVTIDAHPGRESDLRDAFLALVPIARTEPGYIRYDLHEAVEQPGRFVFYEVWKDQASLDLHSNTEMMKANNERTGPWIKSVKAETFRKIE